MADIHSFPEIANEKWINIVKKSILDKFGVVSSTRISSYIVLLIIIFNDLVFTGLIITDAIMQYKTTGNYDITTESLVFFGLILSHHLALLGLKNSNDKNNSNSLTTSTETIESGISDSLTIPSK